MFAEPAQRIAPRLIERARRTADRLPAQRPIEPADMLNADHNIRHTETHHTRRLKQPLRVSMPDHTLRRFPTRGLRCYSDHRHHIQIVTANQVALTYFPP